MHLNEAKFKALSRAQQHKRCAEMIKHAYIAERTTEKYHECIKTYVVMIDWLEIEVESHWSEWTIKILSDFYHYHLDNAGLSHKEHNLLSLQRRGDANEGLPFWPIDIYLDNLRSAHNVGSIIRTTEALSLGRLYFSPQTPFVDNPKVQKTAMGCHTWVECQRGVPLSSLQRPLIALETSEKAASLYSVNFPTSFSLVIGNEEYGCSDSSLSLADIIIEIPLRGRKNSLNVANAFACVATEISRQREQG